MRSGAEGSGLKDMLLLVGTGTSKPKPCARAWLEQAPESSLHASPLHPCRELQQGRERFPA